MRLTKTCLYCKAFDHTVEQCPQLIAKWKVQTVGNPNALQNPNLNPNQNIQMISVQSREANIVVVMREGAATGVKQDAQHGKPQVRPTTQNKISFDV